MRALLVTSIGAAAAGALLLPLAPTGSAGHARSQTANSADAAPPAAHGRRTAGRSAAQLPGHTQSLPLASADHATRSGRRPLSAWRQDPAGGSRIDSREVKPFSLVGVVWDDARAEPHGRLQVQTRVSGTGRWSSWQGLDAHADDRPDSGTPDARGERPRGATAPLWVGASDAVRLRVVPQTGGGTGAHGGSAKQGQAAARPSLPEGVRLELVDPGPDGPGSRTPETEADRPETAPSPGTAQKRPGQGGTEKGGAKTEADAAGERPAKVPGGTLKGLSRAETQQTYGDTAHTEGSDAADSRIGARPAIVTRKGWGANETMRQGGEIYTDSVKAAIIHHTAESNDYSCSQSPALIRGIYRYHVKSSHWRDIGYNFLVDKCGTIFEGRAGGVARPVMGAHTFGFNSGTTGIAVLGNYARTEPSRAALDSLARLTAWKLGIGGVDPASKVTLVSGGGTKYRKGTRVSFNAVSGHRDGYVTDCPGEALYRKLGVLRTTAAGMQGR